MPMTDHPLISIVVRTKDRPRLLERALSSLAAQSWRPLEAVVINDGGDALDQEALQARLGDVALNLLQLDQNTGRANAANHGIAQARGACIGFLDDDDELLPDHVAALFDTLNTTGLAVAYADCEIRVADENGAVTATRPFISYDFQRELLLFLNYIPLICILFRREVFDRSGGFDPTFELYEDWDLLIRASRAYSFAHLAKTTGVYHQWSATEQITRASTGANAEKDRSQYQRILDKHRPHYTDAVLYSVYALIGHLSATVAGLLSEKAELELSTLCLNRELSQVKAHLTHIEEQRAQMTHDRRQTHERLRLQEEENARLAAALSRIHHSKGWRLLMRLYTTRDVIVGTRDQPGLPGRLQAVFQRTIRRFVPKPLQFRIKRLLYRMAGWRQKDKARRSAEHPMISIIVPVYNRSAFLPKALNSALAQDYDRYEVVAVDDGSQEPAVAEILADFGRGQSRLRVFRHTENRGISATLNKALVEARGDYIAFLDCDDFLPPFALTRVAEAIRAHPELGYFFSDRINVNEQGEPIERISFVNRRRDDYLRELRVGMFTDHLKVVRREAFLEAGWHDPQFDAVQDYDFALRYAFFNPTGFGYIHDALYCHRVYPAQISSALADRQQALAVQARRMTELRIAVRSGEFPHKISVVVLSFNKKEHTLRCVEALRQQLHGPCEIILFDNASSRDTVATLEAHFTGDPLVRLVLSPRNLGCPGGRKQAITYASGDYVITLDNDIIVAPGWIEELITRTEEDAAIGGVCSKVIFPDGKIQYNGGMARISEGFVEFSLVDAWKSADDLHTLERRDCDWIAGGATLYRREVYEQVSICDAFENAFEDNDFSLNVKKLGYRLVNCPTARVLHNHVYYDASAVEAKEYMAQRYDHEALKRSVLAFYRRQGLIIQDDYVYRVFGFSSLDRATIRQRIQALAAA